MSLALKIYKGLSRKIDPTYTNEILKYSLNDGRLSVYLSGGYPELGFKYNDLVCIDINDSVNGNLSFYGRFISSNYVVYDSRTEVDGITIADNSLLFELIEMED